jgi:hypothetical protein
VLHEKGSGRKRWKPAQNSPSTAEHSFRTRGFFNFWTESLDRPVGKTPRASGGQGPRVFGGVSWKNPENAFGKSSNAPLETSPPMPIFAPEF